MKPGEIFTAPGEHVLNEGRETLTLSVANSGDRPVQVGSHYHFAEANEGLVFDRDAARGQRLDIPAGTAVTPAASRWATCAWVSSTASMPTAMPVPSRWRQ